MNTLYKQISESELGGERTALCTVVESKGSTPRKAGAHMLVSASGIVSGTVGGGELERQVINDALAVIATRKAGIFTHALVLDHGMCCGGTMQVFIEPIVQVKKLYIFGCGHIGNALAGFAHQLGFWVTVIDARAEMTSGLGKDIHVISKHHGRALQEIEFDPNTFVCVITHDHAFDREIVAHCAKQQYAYLGMIGSSRKVEMARKTFLAGNILTEKEMQNIDWPMGVDIEVSTPEEIAISILAKLIDVRSKLEKLA